MTDQVLDGIRQWVFEQLATNPAPFAGDALSDVSADERIRLFGRVEDNEQVKAVLEYASRMAAQHGKRLIVHYGDNRIGSIDFV